MTRARGFVHRLVRSEWVWLGLIVGLSLTLRLYKLGEWSLWGDEVSNIRDSLRVFELNLPRRSISRILSRLVLLNWGVTEWHARLAPALIGVITILIGYLPLRKALGKRSALLTMLFIALSPWHLYWSQNARFYTAALLFYTLALLAFYFFLEENRLIYVLIAGIFLALAAQEHLTALILLPVAVVYILLLSIGPWTKPAGLNRRNLLLLGIPGGLITLVMAYPFVTNSFVMTTIFGTPNNSPIWLIGGTVYYIGIPLVIVAGYGVFIGWQAKSRIALLLTLSAILPLTAIAIISLLQYSANRYVFVSLTSWLTLAAIAVDHLIRRKHQATKWIVTLLLLVLVGSALGENWLYFTAQNGNRENWRAALEWVSEHKGADDPIFVADNRVGNFYLGEQSGDLREYALPSLDTIAQPIWYVVDMNLPAARPDIVDWLERQAIFQQAFDVRFRARTFSLRIYTYYPPTPLID